MRNQKKVKGHQIGFLTARPPQMTPYQATPFMPPRPPMMPPGQIPPMAGGGLSGAPGASGSGLGGLLQGLLGGSGQIDMASILTNAQKIIGVVNQMGPIVQNLSPMLQMLKGFSSDSSSSDSSGDTLSEIDQELEPSTPPKRRKRRNTRKRRKRNQSKARSRINRS